jgi:hypothetical protein
MKPKVRGEIKGRQCETPIRSAKIAAYCGRCVHLEGEEQKEKGKTQL